MLCCDSTTNKNSVVASAPPTHIPTHIPDVPPSSSTSTLPPSNLAATYNYPSIYEGHFSSVLIPYSQIQSCTDNLASNIHSHYPPTEHLVLLCVLKGSSPFYSLLASALSKLKHPYTMEFTRLSSYVGTQSTGDVQVMASNQVLDMERLRGRHVLVVEDIVDTGKSMSRFIPMVEEYGTKSCEICTLLTKRLASSVDKSSIIPKYAGFSVPDEFVVGFGLDYNEMYRDLEDIWILSKMGIEFGGMDGIKEKMEEIKL